MRRTVYCRGHVAIPAGHRVEVFILREKSVLHGHVAPAVYDLDTSTWYSSDRFFVAVDESSAALTPKLRDDLVVEERFMARVLGAVVGITYGSYTQISTTLYLETEDGGGS